MAANLFVMMISRVDNGKFVNWVAIVYSQLVEELMQWDKRQKIWLKEQPKENQKMMYAIMP
jgi:hypothetical protein